MDVTLLKVLLLLIMGVVPVVFGLLPIKVLSWLARKEGSRRLSSLLLSMLSCFAGGVILGVCLIELLPEAREGMNEAIEADYPLTELLVAVGFFIVYFVEEFIGAVCGHEHDHDTQSTKSTDS
ncbi:Protein Y54G9A.4, partial [Aphelenchoides avenae]